MTQRARTYDTSAAVAARRATKPPPARITVREGVTLPGAELDPVTGLPQPARRATARTQAQRMHAEQVRANADRQAQENRLARAMGGSTVTVNLAAIVLGVMIFVLGVLTLTQVSRSAQLAKDLNDTNQQIQTARAAIAGKLEELAEAMERTKIEYRASRELDMVPATSVVPIYLTAPLPEPAKPSIGMDGAPQPSAQIPPARKGLLASLLALLN